MNLDYPMRFCVLNVDKNKLSGKIASGFIRTNDKVIDFIS